MSACMALDMSAAALDIVMDMQDPMTRIEEALQLSDSDSLGILLLRHTASQCENRVFCLCDIMLCSYLLWFI